MRLQNVRLTLRSLRATPVVTAAAIASLALGIGANTAIFSLVNSLLMRSLPVDAPERLVLLSNGTDDAATQYSYLLFDRLRQRAHGFDGALAWSYGGKSTLKIDGASEVVDRQFVSGDFFSTLGVRAWLGRTLEPRDDVPGGGADGPVAIIGYDLWRRAFGASPRIVGTRVNVDRAVVTIVGVTPPGFGGLVVGLESDLTLPIRTQPLLQPASPLTDDMAWLRVALRMKADQSLDAATTEVRGLQPDLRAATLPRAIRDPATYLQPPFTLRAMTRGLSPLRERLARPLLIVLTIVVLVLLVACANIANLMLARGLGRRHELAVRLALGAPRWRIGGLLLIESATIAALGTGCGLLVGVWAARAIVAQLSTPESRVSLDAALDWRMLAFTAGTMVAAALLFGTVPAARAARTDPIDALKDAGRLPALGTRGLFSSAMVVSQVALSMVLVVAAALFVITFERLAAAPLGLDRERTLVVTASTPAIPGTDRNAFYHRAVRELRAVPGVAAAGGSLNPPIVGGLVGDMVVSEPGAAPPPAADRISQGAHVTPGWFAAYGIPLLQGRDFDSRDAVGTPLVMVVNRTFVNRFLPGREPVGTRLDVTFRTSASGDFLLGTYTIVGVAGDAVYRNLRDERRPTIYMALGQRDDPLLFTNFYFGVRAAGGPPAALERPVAAALRRQDPEIELRFRSLTAEVDDALAQDRVVAELSGFFGALALVLAAVGLYGVTAFAVARRRAELGIRIAIGAAPSAIVRLVLSRIAWTVGAGIAIGAVLAAWTGRFVSSLIYGIAPHDLRVLGGAAFVMIVVAAAAGAIPAVRASRTDAADVLRSL